MNRKKVTVDGCEAAAYISYKTSEVIAIYPITPSTAIGELADAWAAKGEPNVWGTVPFVQEMQSEGGAAGSVHGSLQTGSLTTTFTASQGLLLMIPNMYKMAGELTSTVFQVPARSIATHALSIFSDHSDVMATRATGWGIFFANSVQEVMDLGLVVNASSLEARVPFLHVFDGFRTSHEVMKIEKLTEDDIRTMIDDDLVRSHRLRGLNPDRPVIRGTSQNPDVFFQSREATNPYYYAVPDIVQKNMDKFAKLTGRQYHLFDYAGSPDAERLIISMGSSCETIEETVNSLTDRGEKVGLIKVHLYRPFSAKHLIKAIPATVKKIAVLDRTKEPGSSGEPLYKDVTTAISEAMSTGIASFDQFPIVIGGRYGLSSKEFTPAMVKGVFDELAKDRPKNNFTIGIYDDLTMTSLDFDPDFLTESDDTFQAVFWGLGSDGTVGANKNSIKIIGETTDQNAQGYFVYDSRKAGAHTVSHLRFGPKQIQSTYLIQEANFVAVHQFDFLRTYNVLENVGKNATFLLNAPFDGEEIWENIPRMVQQKILELKLKFYVVDASSVAQETGMGGRINTIMQTCFFAISEIIPKDDAIGKIKSAIEKSYSKYGEEVVQKNFNAVDASLARLQKVEIPGTADSSIEIPPPVPVEAPEFVQNVTAEMIADRGDLLPVSAMPSDGTYPMGTTQWEKRNLALEVPVWEEDICIQCGKCVLVCPHSVIRSKVYDEEHLEDHPDAFKFVPARWKGMSEKKYTLQVAVEDCTGCVLCVEACPVISKEDPDFRAINMRPQMPLREVEAKNWDFFKEIPDIHLDHELKFNNPKNIQLLRPLFEFSSACAGCGETPYLSLLTKLYGDRAIIANATGCSSIYGGNLPTTPWTTDEHGRGPAWINSLFEDNAELGLGMSLALDRQEEYVKNLLIRFRGVIGDELADALVENCDKSDPDSITAQRARVDELRQKIEHLDDPGVKDLLSLVDVLVPRSVWIVGGDGWAYDIGFGGLDHVMASGKNVNILILDTEVYSNTGGQASKATPFGAVAKFAAEGKRENKKDIGMMAMGYGNIYVAQIAMGASDTQTIKTFVEAEAHDGVSLIVAYSQCIAHGIDMTKGMNQQKLAVDAGWWLLYRYNPQLALKGKNPLQLDCKGPKIPLSDYLYTENRFRQLLKGNPEISDRILAHAEGFVNSRWENYKRMAGK